MNLSSISAKVLATSLLLASTTGLVFAKNYKGEYNYKGEAEPAPCPAPLMLKDGFYLGAQAGYDAYRVRQSISTTGFASSSINSLTGWVGGLFVGYGQYFNNMYYLAGELLGNYNGNNQYTLTSNDNDGDSVNQRIKAKGTWGLALLPGLKLNDTSLGYLRLGYDWTSFNANDNGTIDGVAFSGSKNSTQGGWVFGLGIETLVYDNWSVRTEYNHVWYNSFNFSSEKYSPSDNQFMLGVLYHFA